MKLLKEKSRGIIFVITSVVAAVALILPPPDGLTIAGYRALIVFGICGVFWVAHVLPLAITSLLAMVLLPVFGVLDTATTYSLFGNKAVFFIIGALILSTGIVQSGLSERIAIYVLRRADGNPRRILRGVYALALVASFIMPIHAVAAMLLPILIRITRWLELTPRKSQFGKALMFSLVWGSLSGGVATFLGGGRNILAVTMLEESTSVTIGFMEWIIAIMPISILIGIIGYILIHTLFNIDVEHTEKLQEELEKSHKKIGKLQDAEKKMLVIVAATITAWVFFSDVIGLANIALLAVVVLFMSRVVEWKDAEKHVHWGVVLMYGGAIALGVAMEQSGAALYITQNIIDILPVQPWIILISLMVVTLLLTELISNSAVVAMMMPVGLSLALSYGIHPIAITYVIAVAAGFAFMLPMGSPSNALAYETRFFNMKESIRYGGLMNIVALGGLILGMLVWWPILGITVIA